MGLVYFYIALALYIVIFGVGPLLYLKKKAKRKPKLPVEDKLLRGPGESLQQKLLQIEDAWFISYLVWVGAPFLFFGAVLLALKFLILSAAIWFGLLFGVLFLWWAGCEIYKNAKRLEEYHNYRLGHFGERFVAEQLDPLRELGYRIFHDVPCSDAGYRFNIDHVVVGKTGVYAIETKARRKIDRRAMPNASPNKVTFDGERVHMLDWSGTGPLDQAKRQALWLETTFRKKLNMRVKVMPIVTFPLWSVEGGSVTPEQLHVCNPGQLRGLIPDNPVSELSPEEFEAIVRELDGLCRNVGY